MGEDSLERCKRAYEPYGSGEWVLAKVEYRGHTSDAPREVEGAASQ